MLLSSSILLINTAIILKDVMINISYRIPLKDDYQAYDQPIVTQQTKALGKYQIDIADIIGKDYKPLMLQKYNSDNKYKGSYTRDENPEYSALLSRSNPMATHYRIHI